MSKNASGLAIVSNKPAEIDKSDAKTPSNAANRLAQDELFALFESISPQAAADEPKETLKACLTKLGSEFDPKEPAQFEWLSGMPPKDAVERWGKAASLTDDAYRKLVGVAFNMRKSATKEVGAALQTSTAAKTAAEAETAKAEGNAKRTKAIKVFCAPKTAAVAGGKS